MKRTLDLETGTMHELNKPVPGMWRLPTNPDLCCIYRVPSSIRQVNPEAYTPQMVLIGPLNYSLKSKALKSRGDITNTKSMDYLNMEAHKTVYLAEFAKRVGGEETIDGFRRMIKEDEEMIRGSYSESTAWIESQDFVEMILKDAVFIIEFILRISASNLKSNFAEKTGDVIVDEPCLYNTVFRDLYLLENQLPYFILEKLFDPIVPRLPPNQTFRELIIHYFSVTGKLRDDSRFRHFTDLMRCLGVETLVLEEKTATYFEPRESTKTKFRQLTDLFRRICVEKHGPAKRKSTHEEDIKHMYNADKLYNAGVEFVAVKDKFSIDVSFENGYLKIPCLWIHEGMEIRLRNIMALEQCHYPFNPYFCNFVNFLDFLIDDDKDVDLLIEKGIINNWIGEKSSVREMVNKLSLGVYEYESYYSDIAYKINAYYENPFNRSRAVLGRVYFNNLWKGTATVAAVLLLVMTLIQTVASLIQVMQK